MGEKKRRLASGGAPAGPAPQGGSLAGYEAECRRIEQALSGGAGDAGALTSLSALRLRLSALYREQPGSAALADGNFMRALQAVTRALQLAPDSDAGWLQFAECISGASLRHPLAPEARAMLGRALEHPAIQPLALAAPIVSLLRSHPAMPALSAWLEANTPGADGPPVPPEPLAAALDEPLLLRLLELSIVPDALVERLVVLARRAALLEAVRDADSPPPLPVAVLAAVAQQCHATEFVYDVSDAEAAAMDALAARIASRRSAGAPVPPHWLAVFACYRVLGALPADAVPDDASGPLQGLVRSQVLEPAEERRIAAAIPRAAPADNAVSAAVSSLYEANPYPRWIKAVRLAPAGGLRAQLRQLRLRVEPPPEGDAAPRILVAGCGTGQQSIETAQRYPDARILAIDLSLASLAYASRKTRELGLTNIEYRQGDILELGSVAERFDLVESIGVLHHLEDPLRGWRVLRGLLKPLGTMRIGLYSDIARRELDPLTRRVAEQGLQPDLAGIRRIRAQVHALFGQGQALSLAKSPDFYCASGCRDMLFHVMEHRYTLPQVGAMLDELDLRLLGVHMPVPALADRYREAYPGDPDMTDLARLHEFELANPWMFTGLCKFWAQARA